ncbi:hypothetical protein P3X46_035095 [Hevea brasiliensis]|uniref:Cullin N-terminal domain-containing protein n=1 Tax=Hevea brasiliensis TaxID=3981 RepID=A0ABQ9KAM9_HEVBR|nr:cullin-1-like [Hevea brasiliensis]XP_057998750.1 cullin-1-like [Hevea brasiliensis]XP_057998751.1 cullin-1-like [Hevea brasiliensis]XP_057998752.1 cullin-1-like [Hevea brasiliensis]KAJ9131436.1 hypothetical protein P3X46_035095 [Hevea brasiliensis]KAJ9131437.1 hypothetical protein P3X46_035095 [Hevea brasiliensis]
MKSEMNTPLTLEEGLKKIEDAIARKKLIYDAQCVTPFTTAENMLIYDCVYKLCTQKRNYSEHIYEKYVSYLEERIMEKVIPRLLGKHGVALLKEVTQSWSEFKAFADSIYKFFEFLDRSYAPRKGLLLLADAPKHYYGNQVCERLYGKIQEAAISLIIEDREGKDIDRNLLNAVLCLFIGLGGKGTTNYYEKFEQIMLAETAAYYSELSMEWWFWRDSLTSYLRKVDWCLVQEEARAEVYPCKTTKTKLLEVMKYILLERNAKRWAQKQKANGVAAVDQELLSKYASLSLDIGSSASVATATDH